MPVRSETNASERPSGAHTGLMFFPAPMWGRTSTDPDSRWYRATRKLPICSWPKSVSGPRSVANAMVLPSGDQDGKTIAFATDRGPDTRSEEHTSELQSRSDLVCRLLLEKKKKHQI